MGRYFEIPKMYERKILQLPLFQWILQHYCDKRFDRSILEFMHAAELLMMDLQQCMNQFEALMEFCGAELACLSIQSSSCDISLISEFSVFHAVNSCQDRCLARSCSPLQKQGTSLALALVISSMIALHQSSYLQRSFWWQAEKEVSALFSQLWLRAYVHAKAKHSLRCSASG